MVNYGYYIPATNLSHKGGLASHWIYTFIMASLGRDGSTRTMRINKDG